MRLITRPRPFWQRLRQILHELNNDLSNITVIEQQFSLIYLSVDLAFLSNCLSYIIYNYEIHSKLYSNSLNTAKLIRSLFSWVCYSSYFQVREMSGYTSPTKSVFLKPNFVYNLVYFPAQTPPWTKILCTLPWTHQWKYTFYIRIICWDVDCKFT